MNYAVKVSDTSRPH